MIAHSPAVAGLVRELLTVLDEEIALLERKTAQLDRLGRITIDRDEDAFEALLKEIEQAQADQDRADRRMEAIRAALAGALGMLPKELRLGWLVRQLPEEQALAVDYRRQQVLLLARALRRKHMETVFLLHECTRVNRLLLAGLMPRSEPVVTYDSDGASVWRADSGALDAEM